MTEKTPLVAPIHNGHAIPRSAIPSVGMEGLGELTRTPGAWVAYNLGCKFGCKVIRRGDLITAVDGKPISSGAEVISVAAVMT